jgi:hypothetical protein
MSETTRDKEDITSILSPLRPGTTNRVRANECQREHSQTASDHLLQAFDWAETVEGSSFWKSVHQRLQSIAKGESLK